MNWFLRHYMVASSVKLRASRRVRTNHRLRTVGRAHVVASPLALAWSGRGTPKMLFLRYGTALPQTRLARAQVDMAPARSGRARRVYQLVVAVYGPHVDSFAPPPMRHKTCMRCGNYTRSVVGVRSMYALRCATQRKEGANRRGALSTPAGAAMEPRARYSRVRTHSAADATGVHRSGLARANGVSVVL
ncbi:hypothetical protein B0H19DRAFT_1385687 [Mycena capillaripes]|nr:hypothetical protein B0H19DRAFT_1385687 [Mycena capillaripes]